MVFFKQSIVFYPLKAPIISIDILLTTFDEYMVQNLNLDMEVTCTERLVEYVKTFHFIV